MACRQGNKSLTTRRLLLHLIRQTHDFGSYLRTVFTAISVPHKTDRALQGGNRESLAVDPAASAVQPHRSTEAPLADDIEPLKNGSKCILVWRRSDGAARAQKEMAQIKRIYCSRRRAHYQERLAKQRQTLSSAMITPAMTASVASWHQHPPSLQVEEGVQAETSAFECG